MTTANLKKKLAIYSKCVMIINVKSKQQQKKRERKKDEKNRI